MSEKASQSPWVVELVKALAWPALVLVLIVSFWTPLHTVVGLLPSMFEKVDTITLGGVRIDLKSAIAEKTPNNVKLVLPKLTPAGIQYIIENGESGATRQTSPVLPVEQQELIAAGLCREMTQSELDAKYREDKRKERNPTLYRSGFECGDSYDATRKFLLDLIPELVRQTTLKPDSRAPAQGKK